VPVPTDDGMPAEQFKIVNVETGEGLASVGTLESN
jgi:hypothetical protein